MSRPARPIRQRVSGAPVQPGMRAEIVMSAEPPGQGTDVTAWIGERGVVEYLEYDCGCGQSYPDDPMIGVRFGDGTLQEFWKEEIRAT